MTITYGTKQTVKSPPDLYGNGQDTAWAIPLSSTSFLMLYAKNNALYDNTIYGRVYTRTGTSITGGGSETIIVASGANNYTACRLSDTQVLVIYRAGAGTTVYGLVVTVTGTSIAVGGTTSTTASIYFTCCGVSATKAYFAYNYSSRVRHRTVTITAGPTVNFSIENNASTADTYGIRCCHLSGDRCLLVYDLGPGTSLRCRVVDVTASPSASAELTIYGARAQSTFACLGFRSDRGCVAWRRYSSPYTTYIQTIKDQGGFLAPTLNSAATAISPARERFALSFISDDGTDGNVLLFTRDDADHDLKALWLLLETGASLPDYEDITEVEEVQHEDDPGTGYWWTTHNAENFGGTYYHAYAYNSTYYTPSPDQYTLYARIFHTASTETDFIVATAHSPTAMSVSPDDYYVHVGLLDGASQPVLLRLLADLSADPIKAYNPGAGSAIGVQCADLNEEWVWIAGDFGGGVKVRVSIDDGTTWSTRDPGSWNGVALPLVVGPDDDNLVLVPTDGDDDLFETEDGGLTWTTLNSSLPFDVNGMDRLDINLNEIMIGSDADRNIRYTPNNGVTLHDLSDVSMDNVRVSDLIIG